MSEPKIEKTSAARRPYVKPALNHLGSVRELTLGSTVGTDPDGASGMSKGSGASSRDFKEGIRYVDPTERARLEADVLGLRLATYAYREDAPVAKEETFGRHLGFIVEDAKGAPFVRGKHVDVYGFVSAVAATVQAQAERITELEKQIVALQAKRNDA